MPTPPISDSACRILQGKILPGDRLGHFKLVEYVGSGGMGRVFRGVDTRLGRTVALKTLSPEQAADKETLLRFQNEAQSAARLDHENIARVYYVGEDQGLHYIVFEFIEGVNIRDLVERKGPLSLAEAVSYTLQVADALAHADARNLVHRDIKPSNVLITPEGQVKLIDMGLARLRRVDTSAADLTASGVTLGTFDYISPEQARDPRNADIRSDIYSLGCTFYYMLAARPPFPEGTVLQKLLQHQGDQPPDIRQFRPDLPDETARVLRKTLAKDPRHRYREAAELVEDLMLLAYRIGLRPAGPGGKVLVTPLEPKVSFLQQHLPWIVPIAALVCIVVLLDFLWSSSARREERLLGGPEVVVGKLPDPSEFEQSNGKANGPKTPPGPPSRQPPETPAAEQPPPPKEANEVGPRPPSELNGPTVPTHLVAPPESPSAGGLTDSTGLDPWNRLLADRYNSPGLGFDPLASGFSVADETPRMLSLAPDAEALAGRLTGAAGAGTEPTDAGPAADSVPKRSGLLIVKERAGGEHEFPTLNAACSAAVNGDVIELRYNGRREEQPITLANMRVTIRAGEGHQPVVVFRPGEDEIDPVKYRRSMVTLTAGRLTLINLALELDLPREVPAENWSLFEIRGGQTVRLEKCSLSIRNASDQLAAYHPEVAFFRSRSAPDAEVAMGGDSSAATPLARIDLIDSIARGEAVFLCTTDLQPIHLVWENGLLATTERLLWTRGGQEAPQLGDILQVDLRHLTAVVRSGLCRIAESQPTSHQLDTQIYCGDSILMADSGASLIEQVGGESLEDLRQQIAWKGDWNFYENFDVFWTVRNLDQEALSEPMTFMSWQSYWGSEDESFPLADRVNWRKLPEPDRPVHTHTPADYAVSDSRDGNLNSAHDAGLRADRLPKLPPEPVAETPASAQTPLY